LRVGGEFWRFVSPFPVFGSDLNLTEGKMKKVLGGLGLLTLLAFSAVAASAASDPVTTPKRDVVPSRYDASKEVTIEGTVQNVVKNPARGMLLGEHLILSTSKGTIDAHVGDFIIRGPHAVSFTSGQAIKVVGAMSTINKHQVFLVRTVDLGSRTIQVRTPKGFLIVPGTKGRIVQAQAKEGAR